MAYFTMAGNAVANLFKKPACLMYPVKPREYTEGTRGHIENDASVCIFCGICQKKCPADAIKVVRTEKIWEIDKLKCISCSSCVEACPKNCLVMANTYSPALAASEKDNSIEVLKGA